MSIFEQLTQILVEPFTSINLVLIVACIISIFAIIGSARVEEQGGEQFQTKPRPAKTE